MFSQSPTFTFFFVIGSVLGYTAAAILLLSLAALLIRRRRRALIVSISTLSWVVVVSGGLCGLAYVTEISTAWWHANAYERAAFSIGFYSWIYWLQGFAYVVAPQLFWLRRVRTNAYLALAISAAIMAPVNVERVIMYVTSQADFVPSSWKH